MYKIIDTGASSWLFYFCILILARYKNENFKFKYKRNQVFTLEVKL